MRNGTGRCRLHGGATPVGAASPNFKTGLYSKHLPRGLKEKYEAAMADEEYKTLNSDLAILSARLCGLFEMLGPGAGERWEEAAEAYDRFRELMRAGDNARSLKILEDLGGILKGGAATAQTWAEIRETIDDKRKVVDTITKRDVGIVSIEQVMTLFVGMSHIVKKHVDDPMALRKISTEFVQLLTGGRFATPTEARRTVDDAGAGTAIVVQAEARI